MIAVLEAGVGADEFKGIVELAVASGSSGFVAIDLLSAFGNSGEPPVRGSEP